MQVLGNGEVCSAWLGDWNASGIFSVAFHRSGEDLDRGGDVRDEVAEVGWVKWECRLGGATCGGLFGRVGDVARLRGAWEDDRFFRILLVHFLGLFWFPDWNVVGFCGHRCLGGFGGGGDEGVRWAWGGGLGVCIQGAGNIGDTGEGEGERPWLGKQLAVSLNFAVLGGRPGRALEHSRSLVE